MKSIPVTFKNKPMPDGTVVTFTMKGCLVANTGSPTAAKPTIQIHLPKTDNRDINGAFVEYAGHDSRRRHDCGANGSEHPNPLESLCDC